MQKSTLVIASLLLVCMLAACTASETQLTRNEKQSIHRLFNKIIEKRVEKVLQKIERRRASYQVESDLVEDSLMARFLRIVNKVGLQQTKQLIISSLSLIDKSKVKYIENGDVSFLQMSDESLTGYFFQVLSQIGEDTFRSIFRIIEKFIDQKPAPSHASNKYKNQGDYSEMSDESLFGYFWDIVSQIGFDAAKKIFDVIRKIIGDDMPVPPQASDRYKKNREQADTALFIQMDFKQILIKAFPHLARYINQNWNASKNTMNFKEFYGLAFPQ